MATMTKKEIVEKLKKLDRAYMNKSRSIPENTNDPLLQRIRHECISNATIVGFIADMVSGGENNFIEYMIKTWGD